MKVLKNRFRLLLAEKETREGRSISFREVGREADVAMSTIMGLTSGTMRAISAENIVALCSFLECNVGDLFYISEESEQGNSFPVCLKAA